MIDRKLQSLIVEHLEQFPAVALLGPRQIGKTTLARVVASTVPSVYLDLEVTADREKLTDPAHFLAPHQDKLVVIDEVQRMPGLFRDLRGLIDSGRRLGHRAGQYLLLGSASMDLLRQTGESLAGRIAYLELGGIGVLEAVDMDPEAIWLRGGFPESLLAASDRRSLRWRANFIRSYLERDIPDLAPRIATETIRRLWTMLSHGQSTLLNAANLARALAVDGKTVAHHLDLLIDLLLVRRLPPYHANLGKRLIKSPKIYVRDSGLLHALLAIESRDVLLGHPVAGASWEGFVIETLIQVAPERSTAHFYRTAAGAEIDLVLSFPSGTTWAIEIKRGLTAKVERGFHLACADIAPARRFVVHSGVERYSKGPDFDAIGLSELARLVASAA